MYHCEDEKGLLSFQVIDENEEGSMVLHLSLMRNRSLLKEETTIVEMTDSLKIDCFLFQLS